MKTENLYYEALLCHHSIRPTLQRILILNAMLSQATSDFNYTQIVDIVQKKNPELTQGGISTTFRLFKLKGLITKLQDFEGSSFRKGRPRSKFTITQDTMLKLKSLLDG